MPKLELAINHPANVWGQTRVVDFQDDTLFIEARSPSEATIVIHSSLPLSVATAHNAEAKLVPGWDGTLGYSLYALKLSVPAAGRVTVQLRRDFPPAAPITDGDDVIDAFARDFANRPSKFPDDRDAFQAWRNRYRAALTERLMSGGIPEATNPAPTVEDEKEFPGFIVRRVRFFSREDRETSFLLSLPRHADAGAKLPLLVGIHGHEATWGEADLGAFTKGHNDDFCEHFASRGWAVLQPATMDHSLQREGWTLQGEWTWDIMKSLDLAMRESKVDPNRVAVCGLSTGAHLAMNMLAIDGRVRAGVVGCILSTWHHYRRRMRVPPHCDCGITSQLGDLIEPCDWAALGFTRAVQFQHGRQDAALCPGADPAGLNLEWNTGVLPQREFDIMFEEVRRAWSLWGASDQLSLHIHNGPHKVDNDAAFAWLDPWARRQTKEGNR